MHVLNPHRTKSTRNKTHCKEVATYNKRHHIQVQNGCVTSNAQDQISDNLKYRRCKRKYSVFEPSLCLGKCQFLNLQLNQPECCNSWCRRTLAAVVQEAWLCPIQPFNLSFWRQMMHIAFYSQQKSHNTHTATSAARRGELVRVCIEQHISRPIWY